MPLHSTANHLELFNLVLVMMPAKSIFCGSKLSSRSNTLLKSAISGPKLQCGSLSLCSSLLSSVIYMNYTIKWGMQNHFEGENLDAI
jgi:hypothetical protein